MKDSHVSRGQKYREKETQDDVVKLGRGQSYKISVSTQNQFALREWEGIQLKGIKIFGGNFPGGPVAKPLFHVPNAGGPSSIPDQGTKKSFHATTKDPMCCK